MACREQFRVCLKRLRETAGYPTQGALAAALGVNQSTVGNWEAGKREPNLDTLCQIADILNASLDDLAGHNGGRTNDIHPPVGDGKALPFGFNDTDDRQKMYILQDTWAEAVPSASVEVLTKYFQLSEKNKELIETMISALLMQQTTDGTDQ